jgi:hypothetical protein
MDYLECRLFGNKTAYAGSNSHNRVVNCFIHNIGNDFNPRAEIGLAAIGLSNSDNNLIEGNYVASVYDGIQIQSPNPA